MFEAGIGESGEVFFAGRLDAAQASKAESFLAALEAAAVIDFARLEYISSAGLGVLLKTQKRLMSAGGGLRLINVNNHISDVFRYSGFDQIFRIEAAS
jgi:anti-sigma B factor antagonist